MEKTRQLADETATQALAAELSLVARAGDVILLAGDLGTGKSTFARSFIRALSGGAEIEVPSPTFTLLQVYDNLRIPVAHADLYRLSTAAEADELGLAHKISFQFKDYRDVAGSFDRIVSIGMFEHVGISYFQQYFGKIQSLLAPGGVALVHAIGRKGGPGTTGKWLRKYIFPGGYSPALSETFAAIESSGLWVTDTEIWRLHYAETLRAWYNRFEANRGKAEALLGEKFCRMWEFYLITSELSFRYFKHMVFQIQLAKAVDTLPLQRDYMVDVERKLMSSEGGR